MSAIIDQRKLDIMRKPKPFMRAAKGLFLLAGLFNILLGIMAYEANLPTFTTFPYTLSRLILLIAALGTVVVYRRIKVDGFSLLMLFLLFLGSWVGIARGNNLDAFVRHSAGTLFILAFYLAGFNTRYYPSLRVIGFISWVTIGIFAYGFFLLRDALATPGNEIIGLSGGPLLLPLAYSLVKRNWLLFLTALFLIGIGTKRGALLGVLLILLIHATWLTLRNKKSRLIGIMFFLGIGLALLFLVAFSQDLVNAFPYFSGTVERFQRFSSADFSLTRLTSARDREFLGVFESLQEKPLGVLLGGGHGNSYEFRAYSWNLNAEVVYPALLQPDFIYSYFALLYGLPLAIMTVLAIAGTIASGYTKILRYSPHSTSILILLLFVIGYSVDMAISFVSNNPLYWLSMGIVVSHARAHHAKFVRES